MRTRASFEKTLPNYISVENLITFVFDKNIILATFSFAKRTTESIYRVSNAAIGMK